jgi:hypothetical protein
MNYEKRIVFFIDILGFKSMIDGEVEIHDDNCTAIGKVLEYIRQYYEPDKMKPGFESQKISFFSDSIIISFREDEPDQIMYVFESIRILQLNLIRLEVVLRGAVAYGYLYHDDKYIYGPAFNAAYELETKQAIVPRIICDQSLLLLNQGSKSKEDYKQDLKYLLRVVAPDDDGLLYIDYFDQLADTMDSQEQHFYYLVKLKELIEKRMKQFVSNEGILTKYLWMRDRYNEAIAEIVKIPEEKFDKHPELMKFFKKISLIS